MKRRKKKGQRLKHPRSEAMEEKHTENKIMLECCQILEKPILDQGRK